ncbi:M10 family metallopeptidase C-terminal domain-containing protein [Paracoccus luteus]|uniref:M10 family metallopeptidase C-terminal domain-containing protein n=1 Tax=Paracoccus luteus TaxID=2508543 RepID=UPI00106F4C7A|nr:M10 family metallopeptidase C-terminal domain-containing protein [Paracoccus luteus]
MQVLTPQQYAQRLMTSSYSDGVTRTMQPGANGITVNLTDLTAQEKALARAALVEVSAMTGLRFAETTGTAQIRYLNDGSGAQTQTSARGTTITGATVRIASDRVDPGDSYGSFASRTYMHETLHALGLGHPQDYGRVQDYAQSSIANDSWQISLMSYFDQNENSRVDASKAYHLTPMLADYLALRQMYDAPDMHLGNTTYGVGSNAGGALDRAAQIGGGATFLIADHGGIDHVNFAGFAASQRIDLTGGAISSVMGATGNMQIVSGTVIEHATGGGGNDTILGNAAGNRLAGGNGNDAIHGRHGADTIQGGDGNDILAGDEGDDHLYGGGGNDQLRGGAGNDRLHDGAGANLLDAGAGNDAVHGGTGDDRILGGAGFDSLWGGLGVDRINGGDDADQLQGQAGADTLWGDGGNDLLVGGDGNDWLVGGAGNDTLLADSGADVLDGGTGDDLLRGGAGRDRFVFNDGADTVRWFDQTADVIDLRSFAGLDSWADVRAHLAGSGGNVVFRMGDDVLTIEGKHLAALGSDDFLW